MAKLTAKFVENVKAEDVRREISDDLIPALRLVVQPSGARSWAIRTSIAGKTAKLTLGPCSTFTLAAAREWARGQLLAAKAGADPRAAKRELFEAEKRKHQETVNAAVELWLAKDQAENRTVAEVRATMSKWVLPAWGDRPLSSIRKRDVIELIDKVAEMAPVRANRVLAYVKRFLGWCAARDMIETNPAQFVEKVAKETRRDRVLDDARTRGGVACGRSIGRDLRYGRPGAGAHGCAAGRGLRGEAERAGRGWRGAAAAGRAEQERRGAVDMAPGAGAADRRGAARLRSRQLLVLLYRRSPYTAWSGGKERLDGAAARIARKALPEWRLHDLRRTVATGLQSSASASRWSKPSWGTSLAAAPASSASTSGTPSSRRPRPRSTAGRDTLPAFWTHRPQRLSSYPAGAPSASYPASPYCRR